MGKTKDGEEDGRWSDATEAKFLEILYERVKVDRNGTPSFKTTDWQNMDNDLYLATGERFGSVKLLSKYNRLRQKHRLFSDLLDHTGVTYQSSLNTVSAPEAVWQMFFTKNKTYKTFRNKGCQNYELLGQVFNKSTATGHLRHSSSQLPPTSPEERQNEEDFMNYGVHVPEDDPEVEGDIAGDGSPKGKSVAEDVVGIRRSKKKGSEKWDSCMEMIASSASARAEYFTEKAKKCKIAQFEVTSPSRDTYSINACMDALEEIEDVSRGSYNKALVQFKEAHWRKVFMKMSTLRRKYWLEDLE